jgi:hypothetical protein
MAKPRKGVQKKFKGLGRYLIGRERYIINHNYQSKIHAVTTWVDLDWAGSRETRKSSLGGVILLGSHLIKSWASNQNVVALSSGEAEYYARVKGGTQPIGTQSLLGDMGIYLGIVICTGASAAKGIASRRGLGKVRHIDVSQLWIQDKVFKKEIHITKVHTNGNIADALTKSVNSELLTRHIRFTMAYISSGRHILVPALTVPGGSIASGMSLGSCFCVIAMSASQQTGSTGSARHEQTYGEEEIVPGEHVLEGGKEGGTGMEEGKGVCPGGIPSIASASSQPQTITGKVKVELDVKDMTGIPCLTDVSFLVTHTTNICKVIDKVKDHVSGNTALLVSKIFNSEGKEEATRHQIWSSEDESFNDQTLGVRERANGQQSNSYHVDARACPQRLYGGGSR